MAFFEYLDRAAFDVYAEVLFTILEENMSKIAPTGNSPEEEFRLWYSAVREGLRTERRQIILIRTAAQGELIGFFQYFTNETTFMMEEIQLIPTAHGCGIFRALYAFLLSRIPPDLIYAEAYAHRQNAKSQRILARLGLSVIGENTDGTILHFRGAFADLLHWYGDVPHA